MQRSKLIQGRSRSVTRVGALLSVLALVLGVSALPAMADGDPQPVDFTHNATDAPAPVAGAVFGTGPATKTGRAICTTPTQTTDNVNTDCELAGASPHNETSIAVNPTDPTNMIGGVNDYQLGLNPGGHVTESIQSRAHVTFDGGRTWSEYPINSSSAYQATGDPALAFDATGHAYYGTLGFRFAGPVNATNPDVLVANSGDGGRTWRQVRVAAGSGVETSVGDFLDKEYVAAWGSGNAIVTFGDFRDVQQGATVSARIYASVTHDFGATWTKPVLIVPADPGRPLVRGDTEPRVPVRHVVPRRLQQHRRDTVGRGRCLLDRHAQPGLLRWTLRARGGRVLRLGALRAVPQWLSAAGARAGRSRGRR